MIAAGFSSATGPAMSKPPDASVSGSSEAAPRPTVSGGVPNSEPAIGQSAGEGGPTRIASSGTSGDGAPQAA